MSVLCGTRHRRTEHYAKDTEPRMYLSCVDGRLAMVVDRAPGEQADKVA